MSKTPLLGSFHENDVEMHSSRLDVIILCRWENARLLSVFQGPFNKVSADTRFNVRTQSARLLGPTTGRPANGTVTCVKRRGEDLLIFLLGIIQQATSEIRQSLKPLRRLVKSEFKTRN